MPDDVAARLDDVLAGLGRAEPASDTSGVVPLAGRRRRRVAGWLVAAAAVVVGGVVVAPHLPSGGAGSPDASGGAAPGNTTLSNTGQDGSTAPHKNDKGTAPRVYRQLVVVRPRHFTADARATRRKLLARAGTFQAERSTACADLPAGTDAVAAQYRHAPAALVFRRPSGGVQTVELYLCGRAEPVRSTTLPVP
jgi:hypothetical protein